MNHVRALIVLTGVCSTLLISSSAFAWGDVGHSVICQIAYEELKPAIKARIDPKFWTFAERLCPINPTEDVDLPRFVISAILNDTRDLALSTDVK